MINKSWDIYWKFFHENNDGPSHIDIKTNHPYYSHVKFIYRFPISECGNIDTWINNWFNPFRKEVISGRNPIHSLMKSLGHKKILEKKNGT